MEAFDKPLTKEEEELILTGTNTKPSPLSLKTVEKAVESLLNHHQQTIQRATKKILFSEEAPIFVIFGTDKIEKTSLRQKLVEIPYPIHETSEICVFIKGMHQTEKIKDYCIPNVKDVFPFNTNFRNLYTQYADRRKLANSYDLFIVEKDVYRDVFRFFGSEFIPRNKLPIAVRMTKNAIYKVINSATVFFPKGKTFSVRIGYSNMPKDHLVANVVAAVPKIIKLHSNWQNMISIHIKTHSSISLPIYVNNTIPMVVDTVKVLQNAESKNRKKKLKVRKTNSKA
eukprot:TRINITY_DN1702_c0_g1_i1.p1 TRINITY_DN1702_c0_g1~~TRINITY_DN1702_c0_g1_i1.p1  ORF type:complete len:284 (-),score=44.90 TRINITY_DN1702_c0_g1_i1:126-977(-)